MDRSLAIRHPDAGGSTMLLEQGEDLAVVSKVLAHAELSTTADVYAHLAASMHRRAADRMDVVLRHRSTA